MDKEMKIETDREFEQNETKRLNQKYNIQIFRKDCCGKVAEQKTRKFKKLLFTEKVLDKPIKKIQTKKTYFKGNKQFKQH